MRPARIKIPKLRRSTASRLRGLADRLDQSPWHALTRSPRAPLVRIGGAWLGQDELVPVRPPAGPSEPGAGA